ncbi:hypothetical protein [Myxosarcina sp. GI1]|uniref:hypothetical protein n=1 Tax=Myxosarcina sp. GI1 TaxID=1541065 RepID=UPI00055E0781|nr:hypothetical protein [Myxosarcina sp. GI1]
MNQIIKLSIILGFSIGIQPVIATASKSQPAQTTNQMVELSTQWGFSVTDCQGDVAEIKHDVTGEVACIVPDARISSGMYIYDSTNNQIRQIASESTSPPPVQNSNEYDNSPTAILDPKVEQIKFNFDNSYDYSVCLDAVLLAYEQRVTELEKMSKNECANNIFNLLGTNLSKPTTLEIVKTANNYAVTGLEDKLYPSFGLRRRIAIALGFVYDIDKNNNDILKYVSESN